MSKKISRRITIAWRAFSVQALAALATMPQWYPHVKTLALFYFGPDAEMYLQTFIAFAGIIGWVIPQPKVENHVQETR